MAFYQASGFSGFSDSYSVPSGVDQPLFAGSVDLILSIGITQQVFDTLSTALKCIHLMEQVTMINLRSKLLVLENICINQKMMNSCVSYLSWKSGSSNSSLDG